MKWPHLAFCLIWLVTAIFFATLAYESYQATKTRLFRSSSDVPTELGNVKIGPIDIGATLNGIAETSNKNASMLEESIRHSASLTLWLNIISCLMASVGFFAQIFDHRYKDHKSTHCNDSNQDVTVEAETPELEIKS